MWPPKDLLRVWRCGRNLASLRRLILKVLLVQVLWNGCQGFCCHELEASTGLPRWRQLLNMRRWRRGKPGPQPALFLSEEPSPRFGTSGTPALPLAGKRIPLTDGCGATCPCSAHGTVSCPCGVCHAFCGESHCCSPCADGCGRSQVRA